MYSKVLHFLHRHTHASCDLLHQLSNHIPAQSFNGKFRNRMASASPTMLSTMSSIKHQKFDYFLVLDFEATCDNNRRMHPQEIIEFPVLKVNSRSLETESIFHQYVQPQVHKELTPFCIELTGILQDMVYGQAHLPEVLQNFEHWMGENDLLNKDSSFAFVICGDWDLKTMLPHQCRFLKIRPPEYFSHWINIKKSFADMTGVFPKGMLPMLSDLSLKHEGRHHSGIDDCKNIASILRGLLQKGYLFNINGRLAF